MSDAFAHDTSTELGSDGTRRITTALDHTKALGEAQATHEREQASALGALSEQHAQAMGEVNARLAEGTQSGRH